MPCHIAGSKESRSNDLEGRTGITSAPLSGSQEGGYRGDYTGAHLLRERHLCAEGSRLRGKAVAKDRIEEFDRESPYSVASGSTLFVAWSQERVGSKHRHKEIPGKRAGLVMKMGQIKTTPFVPQSHLLWPMVLIWRGWILIQIQWLKLLSQRAIVLQIVFRFVIGSTTVPVTVPHHTQKKCTCSGRVLTLIRLNRLLRK